MARRGELRAVKVADVRRAVADEATASEAAATAPEQFNTHDAKMLAAEVDRLLLELKKMGLGVDHGRVKAAADSQAACEILVAHGLASEAEVQARAYRAARNILAQVLQQAEEQRLQQSRGVQAVRQPGIIVARH